MGKATNMRSWETHVSKTNPDRNYSGFRSLNIVTGLDGESGMDSYGYISFARPFPLGAKIMSATLTFHTWAINESGAHTMYLRRVTEKFAQSRVTWETRPAVGPVLSGISVTKNGPQPSHEAWSFDVTQHLQQVSDGAPWYGWRVTTSDSQWRRIVAQEAAGASRGFEPTLTIEWSDQPDEPASLHPDEGVVGISAPAMSFEYLPIDEDATLMKVHVQTSTSESFAVPTWDSGEQDWTDPTVYPAQLGYPGATQGQVVYWRIRVMDQGGWSGWSPVAEFTYIPEPTLTMLSPPGGVPIDGGDSLLVEGFITDMTPTFTWDCPEQVAYHITVSLDTSTYSGKDWIWDSGRAQAPTQSIELPKGVITRDDVKYRVILRVFDEHDRQSVANDHYTYAGARIVVEMSDDPAITKVTDVVGAQVPGTPEVEATWKRGAAADEWIIIRDAINDIGSSRRVFVEEVDNIDVVQPDGSYKYLDRGAPPRTPYRYSIYPVINGKRGTGTLGNVVETRLDGIWLVMPDFSLMIAGNDQGSWELPEQSTAHQVVGATAPTIIREVHQGYRGALAGVLIDESRHQPGLSSQQKRDRFLAIKEDPRGARLVVADMNIPVSLANMNVYPTPLPTLQFECSFDFWQDGEVWWERL